MPIKKRTSILDSLDVKRKVGLEIEGYLKHSPITATIRHSDKKHDGSLSRGNWSRKQSSYGVEIATHPLTDIRLLNDVFDDINRYGWSASVSAGLHVHVDATDFDMAERLKAGYFGGRVQELMYLFVKDHRWGNVYCKRFNTEQINTMYRMAQVRGIEQCMDIYSAMRHANTRFTQGRYYWMNIFSSNHPTIEFRLFHSIKTADEGKKFSYLVHNLVEFTKGCSLSQLEFIADEIDKEPVIEVRARKLLDAIGVPYDLDIINEKAYRHFETIQPSALIV